MQDYDDYQHQKEREHWAQLDAEEAEREEQAWFDENEDVLLEGPCPKCGRYGVKYAPDTQRPCGCSDTERAFCAHCGEYLGLAQFELCDCSADDEFGWWDEHERYHYNNEYEDCEYDD